MFCLPETRFWQFLYYISLDVNISHILNQFYSDLVHYLCHISSSLFLSLLLVSPLLLNLKFILLNFKFCNLLSIMFLGIDLQSGVPGSQDPMARKNNKLS